MGASLEDIQKRKNMKTELFKKSREAAMKEIKDRQKQRQEKSKADRVGQQKQAPKQSKAAAKGKR